MVGKVVVRRWTRALFWDLGVSRSLVGEGKEEVGKGGNLEETWKGGFWGVLRVRGNLR